MPDTADTGEEDQCRYITDLAMELAADKCGSEAAVKRQVMDMFGFRADEPMPSCDEILADGLQPEEVETINQQRRVAMCIAWRLVQDEDMPFRSAINEAWDRVDSVSESG